MACIILSNLQVVFLFVYLIVECFKKVFIRYLTMGSIVVNCITIIPNTLNKMANCIELRVVKSWLTKFGDNWPAMFKCYLYIF